MTSEMDKLKARKAELRKSGLGAVEAGRIAYREASQRLHEREEAWHDAQERDGQ
ncbi:hypothetical protein GCM10023194_58710 [Planotetraspora phitsanulokensis]|uniref:Uncharacterized protein n=1 Tax=Planotetraspora phitsanulokensis TaxID=575192 RepID=A0A8J3UB13_9ACTN|nr:hypothetical protein [Planotetraspora phitsanulokensis]GII40332.1 hypothetical protein Pph01_53350 [Planotetraspora phitsanulokensis]